MVTVLAPSVEAVLWPGETPQRDIVLGIRPEHLSIHAAGSAAAAPSAGAALRGVVELSENLGSDQVLYCRVGANRVAVRASRNEHWDTGRAVVLSAAADRLHLFDRTSGRRLEWQPASVPAPVA
nr:TOBE domain-containing protein [Arthrobacter sp. H16F315]